MSEITINGAQGAGENNYKSLLKALLRTIAKMDASDLHLVAKSEPQIRISGVLMPLEGDKLDGDYIEKLCYSYLTDRQRGELEENKELDFAIQEPGIGRFRGNCYYTMGGELAASFRIIPEKIPSLDELNAPTVFKEIIKREKGLILVVGPTGSGKSTTLAAMLNEVNNTVRKHIVTIEEPVEFVHENKKCLFSQRGVGEDTKSFANALRSSLREDPDIILVGELRDKETIATALTGAETGHLVFGTLHTNSAVQTINRMVETFQETEQAQIRNMLAMSLTAVIAQALMPKTSGGRIAIHEIFINNPAIGNLIRENKIHQIYSQMQLNQQVTGMQTQTQAMVAALNAGFVDAETAMRYSTSQQELARKLGLMQ